MSLVSAVKDQDRNDVLHDTNSLKKSSSRVSSSVYQTSGEPLSKEALYRAKLKYGVYQSPATTTSTGVSQPKVASDIAANLANDRKITINAYKRLFVDPGAAKAAVKVGAKHSERTPTTEVPSTNAGSQSAATRAYSIASSVGSGKKVSKAENTSNVSRQKSHSISSATHALSARASFSEGKVNPKPKPLNLAKVLSGAEKQAEKRIHDRTTPERKNFSYGLKTGGAGKAAGNSFELTKETLSKISAKVDSSSIEKEADPHHYAEWAAYAVRDIDPKSLMDADYQEKEKKRQEYISQVTSQQVLIKARENTDRELRAIDALDQHQLLFGNEAYNKAAVELAKKNAQKMAPYQNKINMGGGLWLAPEDVNDIARNLINPLLGEVSERADDQRATDLDIKERNETYKTEYAAWLSMQHAKIHNNETIVATTNTRHAKEKETAKTQATTKFNDLVTRKDQQLAEKEEKLSKTKEAHENLKKEMDDKLKSEEKRVKSMIADFGEANKKDLEDAKKEQEELLEPFHDGLRKAEEEHERLIKEKGDIEKEIEKLRASIDSRSVMLLKYERGIKAKDEERGDELQKLQQLDSTKRDLRLELDENVINLANRAKEQAAISSEEARLKQLEIDALINDRKSHLNETEIELQKEKLNMLEAMRKVAEASGDEKIDEERVKKLIGMTSEDYIAQHKELHNKAEHLPVGEDLDEEDEAEEDEEQEKGDKSNDKKQEAKPSNHHLDVAANEPESVAPSASVKSITGVSANIAPDTVSQTIAPKSTDSTPKKHVTISSSSPKIEPEKAEKAEKVDDPSWSEKFFLGGPNAKKRRESLSKASKEETSKPTTTAPAKESNDLEHTFSGFSQGSIAEDDAIEKKIRVRPTDDSEDGEEEEEEEAPELSGPEEGTEDANDANKRSSYFKEVF